MYWPAFDTELLLYINQHHHSLLDVVLWHASQWWYWLPLYVYFIHQLSTTQPLPQVVRTIVIIMVCIASADFVASGVLKPLVLRLRPSHNPLLSGQLHIVHNYVGGLYGFVSSHAANSMVLLVSAILVLKNNYLLVVLCALYVAITAYSRMYLGVHYPLDVVGGWVVGATLSVAIITLAKHKHLVR